MCFEINIKSINFDVKTICYLSGDQLSRLYCIVFGGLRRNVFDESITVFGNLNLWGGREFERNNSMKERIFLLFAL
jgi:hypothetical protein